MATYEELLRENRRLKALADAKNDLAKREQDRRRLAQENWALKHPGLSQAIAVAGKGVKTVASNVAKNQSKSKSTRKSSSRASYGGFSSGYGIKIPRSMFGRVKFV